MVTWRWWSLEILRVAVQHAYLHHAETLDRAESRKPGRERARRIGGEGTPEVTGFAAAELGARLGVSTVSAGMLMADGLDICHRLPRLWTRVLSGEVRVYLARLVARKTRDLTPEQAACVDERVAEHADGRLTYTRFQARVDGLVAAADPETKAERERKAAEQQLARPTRPDEDDHGLRGFYIRAPFATIAVFDAALQRIADLLRDLGDTDDVEGRRVKALLVLSRPERAAELLTGPKPAIDWEALLPQVVVNVHVYAGADDDGIARVERCGVMTLAWVKEHLSSHAKVTVRPVLDIEGQAPADAYEIPDRHRQAVRLMTPADTFPFSSSLDPDQLDHTVPFTRGPDTVGAGQSRVGNYGPRSTPHHRVKTHGRWAVQQPFPGIYVWRDPHGAFYLVGHTGTRRLPKAA